MDEAPSTGEFFGRYRLERRIGHGGMGVVYEAHDPVLERTVALKVLHATLNGTDDYRARFEREAAVLARVRSRHIVQVHDFGSQGATTFLVTEYFPDGDLHQLLRREGVLPRFAALDLTAQVCEGLADAHRAGVLHRDVKPSNVLLWRRDDGPIPYLCDFGIATDGNAGLTQTGAIVGSLGYMAPERHLGLPADVRGDVYSVGCLLWAVLTGSAPYTGTDFQIAHGHIHGPTPQLTGESPLDGAINAVLRDAMAKDPQERIASADELRQRLMAVRREHAADPRGLEPALAPPVAAPATDHTVLRATPSGGSGTDEPETILRPLRAEDPVVRPTAPERTARRWLPWAIAGGVLLLAGGATAGVIAAAGGGSPAAHPSNSPTSSPTPSASPSAPSATSSAPPAGPPTVKLVPAGTCPPTTVGGKQFACHNYTIVVTGFPAGSSQTVSIHACFPGTPCTDRTKTIPVGADGTGRLQQGVAGAYSGYVLTLRAGPAGTATAVP